MSEDEATKDVSLDEDIPVDDVLADAQETLDGIEGADGDDADLGVGGTDPTSSDAGLDRDLGETPSTTADRSSSSTTSSGGGGILPDDLFSLKYLLAALVLAGAGVGLGTVFLPVVGTLVGSVGGLFLSGFLLGLASGRSSYLEVGIGTGIVGAGVSAVFSSMLVFLAGLGVPVFAIGAVTSVLLGVLGHYLGRDLRSGVTRDVDDGGGPI